MKGVHNTLTLSNISLSGLLFLESTSTVASRYNDAAQKVKLQAIQVLLWSISVVTLDVYKWLRYFDPTRSNFKSIWPNGGNIIMGAQNFWEK